MAGNNGCICQVCQSDYVIDLLVPDHLWTQITPSDSPEGGLLCGACIMSRLEILAQVDKDNIKHQAFTIVPV